MHTFASPIKLSLSWSTSLLTSLQFSLCPTGDRSEWLYECLAAGQGPPATPCKCQDFTATSKPVAQSHCLWQWIAESSYKCKLVEPSLDLPLYFSTCEDFSFTFVCPARYISSWMLDTGSSSSFQNYLKVFPVPLYQVSTNSYNLIVVVQPWIGHCV